MYSLFTDASYNYLESGYTVLAGVILDPNNVPVVEFSVRQYEFENYEGQAIAHGLELARQMGITKLRCFTDSLTHAKTHPSAYGSLVEDFEFLTINYIPRRFNQYANALSRVLVNTERREGGDVRKAYHGVNRAKGSFYRRLHTLLENNQAYNHDWAYKRACAKFHCIIRELEQVSAGIKQINVQKMKHLVETLYVLFQEHHFDNAESFSDALASKNIRKDYYANVLAG